MGFPGGSDSKESACHAYMHTHTHTHTHPLFLSISETTPGTALCFSLSPRW